MNDFVRKFEAVHSALAAERGPFALFALFLREDAPDVWDLVVAADWLKSSRREDLNFMADKLAALLTPEEMLSISRIYILEGDLGGFRSPPGRPAYRVGEHRDFVFNGVPINRGFIIASRFDTLAKKLPHRRSKRKGGRV